MQRNCQHQLPYPAHYDEHGGGKVDREDVGTEHPGQLDLNSVYAVVLCKQFIKNRVRLESECMVVGGWMFLLEAPT